MLTDFHGQYTERSVGNRTMWGGGVRIVWELGLGGGILWYT